MPSHSNMTKVNNQIYFFHPEPILQPMECTIQYSSTSHLDRTNLSSCIGSSFTIKWAFDTRIQRSKQLKEYTPGQKNVVYEYHLACKLPSTWAFPPTFFLTWQQLRASIFYGSEVCFLPFQSQGTVFFLLKSLSEVCFLLLNHKGRA